MFQKQIKFGFISSSRTEIRDILKAWLAISLAFAILLRNELPFVYAFLIAALTVGIGFLLHELAHKLTAQHYGCYAEFRSFDTMLILAILMSFVGFIFAAPGAVFISGPVGKTRNGKISAAGPAANLALAALFLILSLVVSGNFLMLLFGYGFMVNTWLALFNMLPFGNFDGIKIFRWSRPVYFTMAAVAVAFMLF